MHEQEKLNNINGSDVFSKSMDKMSKDQVVFEPFIGPRPFMQSKEDQMRFFGRNKEKDEILSIIFCHKVTLIYASSGVGKTSFLNALIIPEIENYGIQVLPTGRIGNSFPTPIYDDSQSQNIYSFNLFQSLMPEIDRNSLAKESLSTFLSEYYPHSEDENGKVIPQLLIIDQLEEFFNVWTNNLQQQRQGFFNEVAEAVENGLRIIFTIREDYLADLDPYADILPGKLKQRFRLNRLDRDTALEAIERPLNLTMHNNQQQLQEARKEAESLVKELSKIQIERPDGNVKEIEGEFVEPIQLQVVCRMWWNERFSRDMNDKMYTKKLWSVNEALEAFYESAINQASVESGVDEEIIRKWCEFSLITSTNTRGMVHKGNGTTGTVPNSVVDILEKAYLIRADFRAGAKWYELSHDRLISPILESNRRFKTKHDNKFFKNIFQKKGF